MAMNADPKKQNKCVQMSLNTPITKCKKFMQKIPRAVAMWLVDYQNNLNAESTATTPRTPTSQRRARSVRRAA